MANDPDVDRLGEAINKLGVSLSCPSCSHEEWTALERPIGLLASEATDGGNAFRTLGLACNYCGFVRLHAASILLR